MCEKQRADTTIVIQHSPVLQLPRTVLKLTRLSQTTIPFFMLCPWGMCVFGRGVRLSSLPWPEKVLLFGKVQLSCLVHFFFEGLPGPTGNLTFLFQCPRVDFCSFQFSAFHILLHISVQWVDTCLSRYCKLLEARVSSLLSTTSSLEIGFDCD